MMSSVAGQLRSWPSQAHSSATCRSPYKPVHRFRSRVGSLPGGCQAVLGSCDAVPRRLSGSWHRRLVVAQADAGAGTASAGDGSSSGSSLEAKISQVYIVAAAVIGYHRPEMFLWFNDQYVTYGLMGCMLAMGITLTFQEIGAVFTARPQLLLLGMFLQYTVLPLIGWGISRYWGLTSGLAVGVALVSCMPGGSASNIVAFIARGDMPLSVMMTTASTALAPITTPLLTSLLVGTLVPVNARAMFLSTLQLVLLPVLVGAALNQSIPSFVRKLRPFTPVLATATVVMIVGSLTAGNAAVVAQSGWQIVSAVAVLHCSGFALGYGISKALGLSDQVCRTNSIEVGMQSSALAAVLAKVHFPQDPIAVAPCVLSACTHATIGSILAGYWNLTSKD